eukprot:scaffold87295_cov20-Tisochrysis_lutea.AAC.1
MPPNALMPHQTKRANFLRTIANAHQERGTRRMLDTRQEAVVQPRHRPSAQLLCQQGEGGLGGCMCPWPGKGTMGGREGIGHRQGMQTCEHAMKQTMKQVERGIRHHRVMQ